MAKNNVTGFVNNVKNSQIVNSGKQIANNIYSHITYQLNKVGLNLKMLLVLLLIIVIYILYVTFIEKIYIQKKETYYIDGRYTYNEAKNVCKSINQRIATLKELYESYNLGANWCKYGWLQSQIVAYPNQVKTTHCGKSGVNGNYQENENKNYGVVCIGIKPKVTMPKEEENYKIEEIFDKISPFSDKYWSYNDLISHEKTN